MRKYLLFYTIVNYLTRRGFKVVESKDSSLHYVNIMKDNIAFGSIIEYGTYFIIHFPTNPKYIRKIVMNNDNAYKAVQRLVEIENMLYKT